MIVTDDQRAQGTLEVMPATLRSFRDRGRTHTNAFASTPNCCPSRASIFSGRLAHNHEVLRNAPGWAQRLDQSTTVQRYLSEAGYATVIFGKYLNNWNMQRPPPHFDRWGIFASDRNNALHYYNALWNDNGVVRRRSAYSTTIIRNQAVDFLKEAEGEDDQPWLLYLAPAAPHTGTTRGPVVEDRYMNAPLRLGDLPGGDKDLTDKPRFVERLRSHRRLARDIRASQLRSLMSVDDLVDAVMKAVEDLEEERDTLAIFISDNGFGWGEHGLVTKAFPYRESVQVPLFIRWPERVEAGSVDDRLVVTEDVAATILDAAGIEKTHELDGRSLLDMEWDREEVLLQYWKEAYISIPSWASIRSESVHFIEYYESGRVTAREYYDLESDPGETTNLISTDDVPRRAIERLARRLEELRSCSGRSCIEAGS